MTRLFCNACLPDDAAEENQQSLRTEHLKGAVAAGANNRGNADAETCAHRTLQKALPRG